MFFPPKARPVFRSIRARIAASYLVVWTAILIASAAGVYALVRANLYRQTDDGLTSCINVIALSLNHEIEEHGGRDQGEESFRGIIDMHQRSYPLQTILIFDGDRLVARKEGELQLAPAGYVTHDRRPLFATRTSTSGEPARLAIRMVRMSQIGVSYQFVVWQPLRSVDEALAGLRTSLLILAPLAILLSGLAGYFLVRESLRPVVRMAAAVNQLNARNLAHSLPVLNSDDELGLLASTFNSLLARLNESFDRQRQFVADASHELKTPVSIAAITAQVALQQKRAEEEYREALGIVKAQLDRLSKLVNDMFLLARSDAGGYTIRKQHCDVSELMLEAAKAAGPLAKQKNIGIDLPDFVEMPIDADPALLHQLLVILLDNAIKYSPSGTHIQMQLENGNGAYKVRVRDQGRGVSPEIKERIFDRFFRVEQTRSDSAGGGAGLGLPIARRIAMLHGGDVKLLETGTAGSTFEVTLPREMN